MSRPPPEAQAREWTVVWIRWVGVAFAVVQVSLASPQARPAGYTLAAILALANLLIAWAATRADTAQAQRRLALGALALDVAVLVGFTYLYAFQQGDSTWLILYLAPLEAAWRFGLRGTLATAAVVSLLYLPRELYRSLVLGFTVDPTSASFRIGVLWIVALFAGFTAHGLARERDTARRLAEERAAMLDQLRAAEQLQAAFISNVSHELRTPLTILIGFIELLQTRLDRVTPAEHREYLNEMARAGRRLTHRIEALLDFATLQEGPLKLSLGTVRVSMVVRAAVEDHDELAERTGVRFNCELDEELVVEGDATRLRTALGYLLDNAIKFNRPGGLVTIRSRRRDTQAVVEVIDTGIGTTRAEIDRIFEPFVRTEAAERGVYAGQGLGLTLAKRIIEAHGGRLEAESQPGAGSTFRITLPAHSTSSPTVVSPAR